MTIWEDCYNERWNGYIVDDAFEHPAKMARGLLCRILDHLMTNYGLKAGDKVVDPFGGVGSTGIECSRRGIQSYLVELEPKFVGLAKRNFELYNRSWVISKKPIPVIIQGDSRNLGKLIEVEKVSGIVSSPPWEQSEDCSRVCVERGTRARQALSKDGKFKRKYGEELGQLGNMKGIDGIITSPPYQGSNIDNNEERGVRVNRNRQVVRKNRAAHIAPEQKAKTLSYGKTEGQLGNQNEETFWTCSKNIAKECYSILKPGGITAWVVKHFVKNKQIVDFPKQWKELCEAEGFETVEEIRSMLVKQWTTEGLLGSEDKEKAYKSYFRRIQENKGAPKIDYETVWIMRKP